MKTMDSQARQEMAHASHKLFFWALALTLLPASVFGLGVRIPNQDPEAIGRGSAFAATANNPSALYYNPAGITQLEGNHIQAGLLTYLGIVNEYHDPANTKEFKTDYELVPVPELYYTLTPKDSPLSYGLGIYAPFGLGLQWPDDVPFRNLGVEARLTYITLNPTIAWQVNPKLSIAAGPTINYSKLKLRQGVAGALLNNTDQYSFKGDDFAYGYHVGILWKPCQQIAIGGNYRSATTVNYRGHSEFSNLTPPLPPGEVGTSVEADFPQTVSGGISYRPTPDWNFEIDVDWTDWNSVDTIYFNRDDHIIIPFALDWKSSWFYHVGGTRYFHNGYFVSAGYFYSEESTSDKSFKTYVPDTNLHVGSLGVGYKGKSWDWAAAVQLITGPRRAVSGSAPFNGQSADGTYQFFVPTVSASIGYHF